MKKLFSLFAIIALMAMTSQTSFAQNVNVNPGAGSYATLKDAFDAINAGTHTGAITIDIVGSTTETLSAVLNASGTGAASYTSIIISPSGGATRTISGAIVGHLIDLNGADNVTIDGLNTGGNSLFLSNTSTGATSTLRFIADANNNTIQNTTLSGSTTSFGVIYFATGTASGNDGNNINNCNIGPAGLNFPLNGIYSLGTSSIINNSGNTLNTNNIFDYFNATLATSGMNINSNNSAWTITNNRLYQTATRIHTVSNTHNGINILSGENYTITGNIIGYANSSGTGTTNIVGNSVALTGTFPSSYSTTGTPNATRYIAINCAFLAGGVASSIQNNTIAGFALYTSSGATTTNGIFCGIAVASGNVNIGTTTGNTIGTPTSSIYTACTTTGGAIVGIYSTSVNTVNIQNNTIQNLDAMGTTATISGGITGINSAGTLGNFNITGNTIGNSTNPNLRMGNLTTGANLSNIGTTFGLVTGLSTFTGILNSATGSVTIGSTAFPNIIQNASQNSSSASSSFRGINISGGSYTISGNIIRNITSANSNITTATGLLAGVGVLGQGGTAGSVITLNIINNLSLSNTTITGTNIAGISLSNTSVDVTRNSIYDLRNSSTSVTLTSPGTASGVFIRSGTTSGNTRIINNMISLGNSQTTNTTFIGIWANHGSSPNPNDLVYYNSVNIEGVVSSGALPSFGFHRGNFAITPVNLVIVDIRNNIFNNTRSGGTGKHYAIGNYWNATASSTGWSTNASNYNVLNALASTVGYWTTDQTFAGWKTASASDANSFSGITVTFTNTATGDLHLNMGVTPTLLESNGTPIAGITIDFDNQTRPGPVGSTNGGGFAPDIGADEFDGVYLDLGPPTISYTILSNTNSTSNRSFTGIAITDFSGINVSAGTKPRCYYKKSTDANVYAGNSLFDNGWKWVESNGTSSPFDFTIDYSIINGGSVGTGDIIQYFVTAQDLAATPNVSINSGTPAATPSSVADYGNIFPLSGTINQYNISAVYSGNYTVGTTGFDNFTTLTGAGGLFSALNAGVMSGNITATVTTDLLEDGTNALNALSYDVPNANYTLKIVPLNASEKLISGSFASGLIRFNGNDYVTIDGNNGLDASGTKYFRFRNTDVSGATFIFTNDSKNNLITNCFIESNNTTTGTIVFSTTIYTEGNDNNSVTDCDIRDRSDVVGRPNSAIYALGTTTTAAQYNNNITISGCNIFDNFNDGSSSIACWINGGNSGWTITNNSFYQTASRNHTAIGAGMFAIIYGDANGNIDFTNNYFGGSAPNCGGAALTFGSTTLTTFMYCVRIFQSSNTVTSNITGNTVANINMSCFTAAGTMFAGIINDASVSSGNINISNNTVGSGSGTGSIVINFYSATAPSIAGIQSAASTQVIQNNVVGGITVQGTITGLVTTFGINSVSNTVSNLSTLLNNNIVGSTSTANSITSSVALGSIIGLRCTQQGTETITNNTIANLTDAGSGTTNSNKGMEFAPAAVSPSYTITGNVIRDITTSAANVTVTNSSSANILTGLSLAGSLSSTSASTISQNNIYNLSATTVGANNVAVRGIGQYTSMLTAGTFVMKNRIYGLTTTSTGTAPMIVGYHGYFVPLNFANNQITLTNGEPTDSKGTKQDVNNNDNKINNNNVNVNNTQNNINVNRPVNVQNNNTGKVSNDWKKIRIRSNEIAVEQPEPVSEQQKTGKETIMPPHDLSTNGVIIQGMYDADGGAGKTYNYNSIYIGGNATINANNSFCYTRESFSTTVTIKNNLFINARTGGTGKHFVINNYSATNWISGNINYNVFLGSNAATIGSWIGVDKTIADWRISSASDKQTWSDITANVNPSNLLTSISTGNLNIITSNTEAWLVSGKGIALTGFNSDYNGDARVISVASGTTDIGSDEFGALGMNTPTATVDFAPGTGVTSTYTLWGRTVLQVVWGSGGSFYPSSLDVYYNSGVNPPNTLGGNYSNSHTVVNSNGTPLTGTTYDIIYYFGDNETYTIGTPGASTILAKYNTTWEVYHLVQPGSNSVLTYNTVTQTYTVAVTGLYDFSTFALTDDGSALPVTLENFDITVAKRDAVLNWTTISELNNKGFGIERRVKIAAGYSDWKEVSFVNGNGTSNEKHVYSYKDAKLLSGLYQYRLKQVDFNNNTEYYHPTNNSDVIIGKPGSFDVSQNYPNPSNPKSKIDFQMPFDGKVSIKVYDILGQQVTSLIDEFKQADFYTVEFDGSNIASGTYFYRIIAEGDNQKFTKTLKMILVK